MSSAVIAGHINHPLFDFLLLILLTGNINFYVLLWFLLRILAILSLLRILILGTLPLPTLRWILLSSRHVARLGSRRANVTIGFLCLWDCRLFSLAYLLWILTSLPSIVLLRFLCLITTRTWWVWVLRYRHQRGALIVNILRLILWNLLSFLTRILGLITIMILPRLLRDLSFIRSCLRSRRRFRLVLWAFRTTRFYLMILC